MSQFHGLWVGELTDLCQMSVLSYLYHGHSYTLWTYDDLSKIQLRLPGAQVRDASQIVPRKVFQKWQRVRRDHAWPTFANYFRYRAIYLHGGWWADLDSVALKKHDFTEPYVFTSIRNKHTDPQILELVERITGRSDGNIPNGCFKAPTGAPFLRCLMLQLESEGFHEARCPNFGVWGTMAFTKLVYEFELEAYQHEQPVFCCVPPYRSHVLYDGSRVELPEWAYSIHFYTYMNRYKNAHPDSLYSQLKNKYLTVAI